VVALGLLAIGIPYAPLWGFVAAMLRFVPFVGTSLAMLFPAALAFVQFEGWGPMLATLALFIGLDIVTAYVVEPLVIGAKTGVSSMAMVVSAIFWTWMWGPVGLVLSTPMTVCLVVLGKHVTRLEFLAVLLSDEPAWNPNSSCTSAYWRATRTKPMRYWRSSSGRRRAARSSIGSSSPLSCWRTGIAPATRIAEADHDHVCGPFAPSSMISREGAGTRDLSSHRSGRHRRCVFWGVSRSATDELIWEMLAQLFDPTRVAVRIRRLRLPRLRTSLSPPKPSCPIWCASSRSRPAACPGSIHLQTN